MNKRTGLSFKVSGNQIGVLDQRALPKEEKWLKSNAIDDMIGHIKTLSVRGAPLIAIAAGYALAQLAEKGVSDTELVVAKKKLISSRPTAVNLANAMNLMIPDESRPDAANIIEMAQEFFDEDVAMCDKIANFGAKLIQDGDGIVHHCNTGGLATAGCGTALGIIKRAHKQGKHIHVYVDETRPLLQGARLTVWELQRAGVPYSLITDGMAAHFMAKGKIHKAFVGADRIARNGDFANKIGTYALAIACQYHGIPFYMAAASSTIDSEIQTGKGIPIEERDPDEVRGYKGPNGEFIWTPAAAVKNPAFDVTPAKLLAGIVTERGILEPNYIEKVFFA